MTTPDPTSKIMKELERHEELHSGFINLWNVVGVIGLSNEFVNAWPKKTAALKVAVETLEKFKNYYRKEASVLEKSINESYAKESRDTLKQIEITLCGKK